MKLKEATYINITIGSICFLAHKKLNERVEDIWKNTKVVVVNQNRNDFMAPHELMHTMGLYHTFDNDGLFTYKFRNTDNIMDYTHQIKKKRFSVNRWQWKILNPTGIMKLKLVTILFGILQLTSCKGQDKESVTYLNEKIMNSERFDIEKHKKCLENKVVNKDFKNYPLCGNLLKDGTIVYTSENTDDYQEENIPKAPNLIKKIKLFYLNTGRIKEDFESYVSNLNLRCGISKYYDEQGYLIKTVDENLKYKNVKINMQDLFEILKREQLLDKLSDDEKEQFNNIFSLGKENKDVALNDVFKYLKRDKILSPSLTDTSVLDREDRFLLELSFNEEEKKWYVVKELYPFGQIWLQVDAMTGRVSNKVYHRETRP